jgi:hypothetical protein
MENGFYVDVKVSVTNRLFFKGKAEMDEIIEKLKNGYLPSELTEHETFDSFEYQFETETCLSPSENNYFPTIEVFDDVTPNKLIWSNKL